MNYLLDTNALLWALEKPERLGDAGQAALLNRGYAIYISPISCYEMMAKNAKGKLDLPPNMREEIAIAQFIELPLILEDGFMASTLPPLHADPFDRLLIAQAIRLQLTIITADRVIAEYPVKVLKI